MSGPQGIANANLPGLPDPASLLPTPRLGGAGSEVARTLLAYVDGGVGFGQAFANTVQDGGNAPTPGAPGLLGDLDPGGLPSTVARQASVDPASVAQAFTDLPADLQQRVLNDANAIPPTVRDALDQLGITQPQARTDAPATAPSMSLADPQVAATGTRDAIGFARAETMASANTVAQALGAPNAQTPAAAGQAASAFAAQDGAPQANALANGPQPVQVDRAARENVLLQQPGGRPGDGQFAARAPDAGNAVVMADRNAAVQQQAQALPAFAQGRADALPGQAALATLAGATVLANPQGNPLMAQTPIAAPAGSTQGLDGAALQARDVQLAPAGHTVAGFLRRDLRKGLATRDPRGESLLAALLPGRRRQAAEQEQSTSFQWLFWILTIAAYASLAVAVIAMIPSGGALTDGTGRPSNAGYALVIGAIAAMASWLVGRRMAARQVE